MLLDAGADPNGQAEGRDTPLYAAASRGQTGRGRQTPLNTAAQPDDPRCVQMLLDAGAEPNGRAKGRDTPLFAAAFLGQPGRGLKTVPLLLKAGADPDAFSTGKDTPLYGAILTGQDDFSTIGFYFRTSKYREGPYVEDRFTVIKTLLNNNADADAHAVGKQTPLYAAAAGYESDRGLVSLLLENGADPDAKAQGKETPLLHILDHIRKEKHNMLIYKNNAKKGLFDFTDMTAEKEQADKAKQKFKNSIHWAIDQVINPLAAYGADPDANTQQEEETPRYIAAKKIDNKELKHCLDEMREQFKKRH